MGPEYRASANSLQYVVIQFSCATARSEIKLDALWLRCYDKTSFRTLVVVLALRPDEQLLEVWVAFVGHEAAALPDDELVDDGRLLIPAAAVLAVGGLKARVRCITIIGIIDCSVLFKGAMELIRTALSATALQTTDGPRCRRP